jgi:hypothetical protein
MAPISLTGINARGNYFFPSLGALALSPSHGEVGGRLFLCGGTPLRGQGAPQWQGRGSYGDQKILITVGKHYR